MAGAQGLQAVPHFKPLGPEHRAAMFELADSAGRISGRQCGRGRVSGHCGLAVQSMLLVGAVQAAPGGVGQQSDGMNVSLGR